MVYLSTQAQIDAAYGPFVGFCDYIAFDQHQDSAKAVALAALRPGQSVLDVGAGSGRLIAQAKEQVNDGICVAADAVEGFVSVDIPWLLSQHHLTVAPDGTPSTQVHCLQANLTSPDFSERIRAIRGAPQHFDCIFALYVFNTLAPEQRRPALTQLRRLLSPNGHLILTMSARFCLEPSLEATTSVQFRTAPHTEAPGAAIEITMRRDGPQTPVALANQDPLPSKTVTTAVQIAPDRFWTIAAAQGREAAEDADFLVSGMEPIGKGDNFGLPVGRHSPPDTAFDNNSPAHVANWHGEPFTCGTYSCVGRTLQACARRLSSTWASMPTHARDWILVEGQQQFVEQLKRKASQDREQLPSNGPIAAVKIEPTQVGVLMKLHKY